MKKILLQTNRLVSIGDSHLQNLKWSVWNDRIRIDTDRMVIFNTSSRNAILAECEELKQPHLLERNIARQLFELGFLVTGHINEKAEWEKLFAQGKKDLSYLDLTILLTNNCQMCCVYCFEGTKMKNNMQKATMNHIIDFLKTQVGTCKKLRVTWFGGEPLLVYYRLKELSLALMEFCNSHQIEYKADITTNGFALNEARCHEMVSQLQVKRYIITIDGLAATHDVRRPLKNGESSFSTIWHTMELLVDTGAWVTIRMTIDKNNAEEIPKLLDFIAKSKLCGRVGLSFCRTIDYNYTPGTISHTLYTEAEFAEVEWRLIQHAHSLGLWQYRFPHAAPLGGCLREGDIVIGAGGEIYKCLDTVGNRQWAMGHLAGQSVFKPLWYTRWQLWTPLQSDSCKDCVLVPLCNGGCPHNALFADKKHGTETCCPDWKSNYQRQIISLIKEQDDKETL